MQVIITATTPKLILSLNYSTSQSVLFLKKQQQFANDLHYFYLLVILHTFNLLLVITQIIAVNSRCHLCRKWQNAVISPEI